MGESTKLLTVAQWQHLSTADQSDLSRRYLLLIKVRYAIVLCPFFGHPPVIPLIMNRYHHGFLLLQRPSSTFSTAQIITFYCRKLASHPSSVQTTPLRRRMVIHYTPHRLEAFVCQKLIHEKCWLSTFCHANYTDNRFFRGRRRHCATWSTTYCAKYRCRSSYRRNQLF